MLATLVTIAAESTDRAADPDIVRPGYLALLIFLIGVVALTLLMFSLAKHLRRAREPWAGDPQDAADTQQAAGTPSPRD